MNISNGIPQSAWPPQVKSHLGGPCASTAVLPMMPPLSVSSSDSSMSSTSRLSFSPTAGKTGGGEPPGEEKGLGAGRSASSSMAEPSRSGSGWDRSIMPRKGDSEPVGDGASAEGDGMGDSSRSGSVLLRASSLRLRWDTRLAKVW